MWSYKKEGKASGILCGPNHFELKFNDLVKTGRGLIQTNEAGITRIILRSGKNESGIPFFWITEPNTGMEFFLVNQDDSFEEAIEEAKKHVELSED